MVLRPVLAVRDQAGQDVLFEAVGLGAEGRGEVGQGGGVEGRRPHVVDQVDVGDGERGAALVGVGAALDVAGEDRRLLPRTVAAGRQAEGLSADMAALGKRGTWESRTDAKVPAPADIAARLGIAEGDLTVRTAYEFLADGKPVQLSTSWEPYALTAGTLVVLPEGGPHAGLGVVRRMAEIGFTVTRAVEQPSPRAVTAEEATLLGVQKSTLATHIVRTYYAEDGRPVETADIVVPAPTCDIVYEVPVTP